MMVDVHFTTQLRAALGKSQDRISLDDDSTLADLIRKLARTDPQIYSQFVVDHQGNFLPNILFCVDDQQVSDPQAFRMHDGACVTILSAISGG